MINAPQGKSLRIFLADGSPSGIRHAELVNWSGQALVCPRARLKELSSWEQAQRPGVYFLVGEDPDSERDLIYVGEAENVQVRLESHYRKSDFWRTALLFTSKDENLTKSHVKYLEARLIEHAKEVGRVQLQNANTPARPRLPKADQVDMEGFLAPLVTLSGALGFRFLESARASGARVSQNTTQQDESTSGTDSPEELFCFKRGGYCSATGYPTDDGFLVLAGAVGPIAQREYARASRKRRLDELVAEKAVRVEGYSFELTRNVEFASPSTAAEFISGASINGRKDWRLPNGQSLAEWEADGLKEAA